MDLTHFSLQTENTKHASKSNFLFPKSSVLVNYINQTYLLQSFESNEHLTHQKNIDEIGMELSF